MVRIFFGVALVLVAGFSAAAEKKYSGINAYDDFPPALRLSMRTAYLVETKNRTKAVADSKTAVAKAKPGTDKDQAKGELVLAEQSLADLKSNFPPFFGHQIECCHGSNGQFAERWVVGDFGVSVGSHEVLQVLGDTKVLMFQRDGDGERHLMLVDGFSTKGMVDGNPYRIPGTIWVSGTTAYDTVGGGTKTVLKVEPFDWDQFVKQQRTK